MLNKDDIYTCSLRLLPSAKALFLCFGLLAALFFFLRTPAHAATITVCPSGGDFATLQAAVNNAAPGDVITICAGQYSESVNLSLMGSAIGGSTGNLTIQASGAVTMTPASGPALYLTGQFAGNLTLIGLSVTSPDDHAIYFTNDSDDTVGVSGALLLDRIAANDAARNGIRVRGAQYSFAPPPESINWGVVLTGVQASGNGAGGVEIASDYPITVTNSVALSNTTYGLLLSDYRFEERCSLTLAALSGVLAGDNGGSGVEVGQFDGSLALTVRDSRFLANGDSGLIFNEPSLCSPDGSLTVDNSIASGNRRDGFTVNNAPTTRITRTTTRQNQEIGLNITPPADPSVGHLYAISGSLIMSNAVGIQYDARFLDSSSFAVENTQVQQNMICANTDVGIMMLADQNMYTETLDAPGNWWGALAGPTHPSNPTGSGDRVRDAATNTGAPPNDLDGGYVAFAPWIDQIAASVGPGPYQPGAPVSVIFSVRDLSNVWNLTGGPGALLDAPPFTVATDNGEIEIGSVRGDAVATFLTNEQGQIFAIFTPGQPGAATVTLHGPCGIAASLPFTIEETLAIEKSPPLQFAPNGAEAAFTLTITNSGILSLTNVAVLDTLAPSCSRVSGALPDLAPQSSFSYTCTETATTSYTNVATVTAQTVAGSPITPVSENAWRQTAVQLSASASAVVQVVNPSLVVTKSVALDPNACNDGGNLLAPIGSWLYYCLTLTNTGDVTFTTHTVDDAQLGIVGVDISAPLLPGASLSITRSVLPALGPFTLTAPISNTVVITSTGDVGGGSLPNLRVSAFAVGQVSASVQPTNLPPEPEPDLADKRIYLPAITR